MRSQFWEHMEATAEIFLFQNEDIDAYPNLKVHTNDVRKVYEFFSALG